MADPVIGRPGMEWLLLAPIVAPLLCALAAAAARGLSEKGVGRLAAAGVAVLGAGSLAIAALVAAGGSAFFELPLFSWGDYRFELSLLADAAGAAHLAVTAFLGGVVLRFSRYYLHREPGHRRFFATMLLFLGGMATVSLAAQLDTFFLGWEVVGIASAGIVHEHVT